MEKDEDGKTFGDENDKESRKNEEEERVAIDSQKDEQLEPVIPPPPPQNIPAPHSQLSGVIPPPTKMLPPHVEMKKILVDRPPKIWMANMDISKLPLQMKASQEHQQPVPNKKKKKKKKSSAQVPPMSNTNPQGGTRLMRDIVRSDIPPRRQPVFTAPTPGGRKEVVFTSQQTFQFFVQWLILGYLNQYAPLPLFLLNLVQGFEEERRKGELMEEQRRRTNVQEGYRDGQQRGAPPNQVQDLNQVSPPPKNAQQ